MKQYLQIQFGSDPHKQLHIQIIVVCHKRLGSRASSNHVHHRRFHFEETHIVEELANVGNDLRANVKFLSDVRIDNQVQITLSETCLLKKGMDIPKLKNLNRKIEQDFCTLSFRP